MMMRELVMKIGTVSATLIVAATLSLPITAHAESKKGGGFGKDYDHDFSPSGGDPSKGPGFLDNAVIRLGNTVIRTGESANGPSAGEISKAERARKARELQNRTIDATSPR